MAERDLGNLYPRDFSAFKMAVSCFALQNPSFSSPRGGGGGERGIEVRPWTEKQLAKRSSQNVDSGVRNNKYFRSTSGGSDELRPEH